VERKVGSSQLGHAQGNPLHPFEAFSLLPGSMMMPMSVPLPPYTKFFDLHFQMIKRAVYDSLVVEARTFWFLDILKQFSKHTLKGMHEAERRPTSHTVTIQKRRQKRSSALIFLKERATD
jgi:hypothetical protein